MSDTPGALQLRLLQTVVDVAAEKNSTLVMPFPVELLRFFERATAPQVPAAVSPHTEVPNGHHGTIDATAIAPKTPDPVLNPA